MNKEKLIDDRYFLLHFRRRLIASFNDQDEQNLPIVIQELTTEPMMITDNKMMVNEDDDDWNQE